MLNYLLVVIVIVAWSIFVTLNADPVEIDHQIDQTINSQITNNVLDYAIDKFFFETNWDWLKPWWYSLWYYLDTKKKEYNDSIHLKFLWNWKMNDSIFNQLWEYHKDLWWFSRFIDWEDDWNTLWVLVEKVDFDWKWDWYWENNISGFRIKIWKVIKTNSWFDFHQKHIFFK